VSASDRSLSLNLGSLRQTYGEGTTTPAEVIDFVLATISDAPTEGIWIHLRDRGELLAEARSLARTPSHDARSPLYGVPFAVKDSIDVAGIPTTVACPDFAYVATESAPVVRFSSARRISTNLPRGWWESGLRTESRRTPSTPGT
jgi:allophanate hydrolase